MEPALPSRILRDGILRSERVFSLSPQAEVFYRRLMSVADDFGRYYANPILLLSDCFPLRPIWADENSLGLWIEECRAACLLSVYEVKGSRFLEIENFGQRIKAGKVSKFPDNPGKAGQSPEDPASRARSTPTTPSNPNGSLIQSEKEKLKLLKSDDADLFAHFENEYINSGYAYLQFDFIECKPDWAVLDFFQKQAAVKGMRDRVEAKVDPKFIPKPRKYLQTHEWERKIPVPRNGRPEPTPQQSEAYLKRFPLATGEKE